MNQLVPIRGAAAPVPVLIAAAWRSGGPPSARKIDPSYPRISSAISMSITGIIRCAARG
jgi:hypothetical protein